MHACFNAFRLSNCLAAVFPIATKIQKKAFFLMRPMCRRWRHKIRIQTKRRNIHLVSNSLTLNLLIMRNTSNKPTRYNIIYSIDRRYFIEFTLIIVTPSLQLLKRKVGLHVLCVCQCVQITQNKAIVSSIHFLFHWYRSGSECLTICCIQVCLYGTHGLHT